MLLSSVLANGERVTSCMHTKHSVCYKATWESKCLNSDLCDDLWLLQSTNNPCTIFDAFVPIWLLLLSGHSPLPYQKVPVSVMSRIPTCIIWFVRWTTFPSLSFLKFLATQLSWNQASDWWFTFSPLLATLLPGPNYYSNNIHLHPTRPLAHWDEVLHCYWGQAQSQSHSSGVPSTA